MEVKGVVPDIFTYNTLIALYWKKIFGSCLIVSVLWGCSCRVSCVLLGGIGGRGKVDPYLEREEKEEVEIHRRERSFFFQFPFFYFLIEYIHTWLFILFLK